MLVNRFTVDFIHVLNLWDIPLWETTLQLSKIRWKWLVPVADCIWLTMGSRDWLAIKIWLYRLTGSKATHTSHHHHMRTLSFRSFGLHTPLLPGVRKAHFLQFSLMFQLGQDTRLKKVAFRSSQKCLLESYSLKFFVNVMVHFRSYTQAAHNWTLIFKVDGQSTLQKKTWESKRGLFEC